MGQLLILEQSNAGWLGIIFGDLARFDNLPKQNDNSNAVVIKNKIK